ncbi:undecaprenyl-diphosphate phosphatase [Candidatus Dependentiae bacterium]|nr:undecaprenyl-diphosphate phosphatase [Candidatus Dependentiae bacterium]
MLCFYAWILVHLLVESLPLSSSGHLFILQKFLCENLVALQKYFFDLDVFSDVLHGVTACVVALFFFRRWFTLLYAGYQEIKTNRMKIFTQKILLLVLFTGIADGITSFFYFVFKNYGMPPLPVYVGFAFTAVALFVSTYVGEVKNNKRQITQSNFLLFACILGIVQGIALLPGISRLATTYTAGRLLGFSHRNSFAVSFMIQWPLIVAASTVGIYKLYSVGLLSQLLHLQILLVIVIGGVGAWYALILTEYCARKNKLYFFSVYLLIIVVLLLLSDF